MAGAEVGTVELNDAIFGIEPNSVVVHEVVKNHLANCRQGTQSALTRAEVSGGGRKPWRQKGTGHARQGSTRAPQWTHGGIVFAPKPRDYSYVLNKKVKRLALKSVLSARAAEGKLIGYNTDGIGFYTSLTEEGGVDVKNSTFFCFGAGGAGRAMCSVLAYYGAKKIYITDFFEPCAQALVDDINNNFAPIAEFVHHGDTSKVPECDVVMNASGVGMGKSIGQSPVEKEILKSNQFCFDACYNPAKTQFLLDAEAQGCKILNGLGMSLYQGAAQIELWTGHKAPVEAMRQELLKILEESK